MKRRLQFVFCTQIGYLYMKIGFSHSIAYGIYTNFASNGGRPITKNTRTGRHEEDG